MTLRSFRAPRPQRPVLAALLTAALVLGAAAPAAAGFDDTTLALDAGYAFRGHSDGRSHGAAANLLVDVPGFLGPLGARLVVPALAFGPRGAEGGPALPPLLLAGAGTELLYSFDDTTVQALLGLGAFGALEAPSGALRAGGLLSLTLRFPLARAASLQARVAVPLLVWGPEGFSVPFSPTLGDTTNLAPWPTVATATIGLALEPAALWQAAADGDVLEALLPSF